MIQQELEKTQRDLEEQQQELEEKQTNIADLTDKMKSAPSAAEKAQLQGLVDEQRNMMALLQEEQDEQKHKMTLLNQDLIHQKAQWNKQMTDRVTKMDAVFDCLKMDAVFDEGAIQGGATRGCNFEVGSSL